MFLTNLGLKRIREKSYFEREINRRKKIKSFKLKKGIVIKKRNKSAKFCFIKRKIKIKFWWKNIKCSFLIQFNSVKKLSDEEKKILLNFE